MNKDIHVPKETRVWRIPQFGAINLPNYDHIDPSRPEDFKIEEVYLVFDEKIGVCRGYSKYLNVWIIADS